MSFQKLNESMALATCHDILTHPNHITLFKELPPPCLIYSDRELQSKGHRTLDMEVEEMWNRAQVELGREVWVEYAKIRDSKQVDDIVSDQAH